MSIRPAVVIVQCAEVVYLGFCKRAEGANIEIFWGADLTITVTGHNVHH